MVMAIVGKRIRQLRIERGMKQQDLADNLETKVREFIARHKTLVTWLCILLVLLFARSWPLVVVGVSIGIWLDGLKPSGKK